MIAESTTRTSLRAIAVAIALAAVMDPAVTSNRATKPEVVVLPSDSARDASLADDIARQIGKTYTVARGTSSGAGATVIAGRTLPLDAARANALTTGAPIFAVSPPGNRPDLNIVSLDVPASAPALSRVRVDAVVRVVGARGKTVDLTLRNDAVSLDHTTRRVAGDDDTLAVALSFIPAQAAPTTVRLVAHIDDARDAIGDALVDVRDQKWAVLFYEPRPSWMSTFVRRAIERDPRFVATARVVTSRDVTASTGNPPGRLDDVAALSLFDAVVVGAPSALSSNDVAGLEAFMRRRGGSVVLLLDEQTPGPVEQLMGVGAWRNLSSDKLVTLATNRVDSLSLQASTIMWPAVLPAMGEMIAGDERAIVWREPVGAGVLVVSGALDAWRFRDPASSKFERFWQTTIGDAASRTPPPLSVSASNTIVAPDERFDVAATLRDEAIDMGARSANALEIRANVQPTTDSGSSLHLWPRGVGELAGSVRAPSTPGLYRINVQAGGRSAELPFVVAASTHRVTRGAQDQLVDHVRATNGAMIPAAQLGRLSSLLADAIRVEQRIVTWHPMRSAWWIVPFALALAGEWWLRRRRGLP